MLYLVKTSNSRLLLLITFYTIYLFMGAIVLDNLESPHEAHFINELNRYVENFRHRHNDCLPVDELNEFIKLVSTANDQGVPALKNVSKEQNWSFGQAFFFSGTVLTTIGYGDVYPQTQLGKIFCIIFASIGIPITLLLLYAIIERLMVKTSRALDIFINQVQPALNTASFVSKPVERSHMHILFAFLCTFIVLVLFFLIPAAIYSDIEGWSFLNAFYYCFISLSTVGLGDYVPGDSDLQNNRHLYKIFSTLYLIIGVMIVVWLLQIYSETPEFNFYKFFTLSKDGILTHHIETVHPAASFSKFESSHLGNKESDAAFPYGKYSNEKNEVYDPIDSPKNTHLPNDSEQILDGSNSNSNYLSTGSFDPPIQQ
ncbi:potassium channel subfamily K member 1-like [Brachionus plicatilis]|uniref:Potassium channel subfamily K member 1-like n=1 Tax=Brachionus plicatilis TaxID=10195 RepID=A0A3M7SW41_BRAPC|nr:potassium channel subfamily K member 1-like [Brachionus plicatilis]